MRCEKAAAVLLSSVLVLGQAVGTTGQIKKEGTTKPSSEKSLIRKDLLVLRQGDLPLPRRNIFSPSGEPAGMVPPPVEKPVDAPPGLQPEENDNPNQEPEEPALNLSYIGFVRSANTIIALVVLDGQPVALNEGEMIRPGFKLVKITPRDIEVSGPDSKTQKFSLQGGKGED